MNSKSTNRWGRIVPLLAGIGCCFVVATQADDPTWKSVGPGGWGAWGQIAFSPSDSTGNTLLAGTDVGGPYRSTDGGATWTNVTTGLDQQSLWPWPQVHWFEGFAFASPPNANIVYGACLATLMKSLDGGVTWAPANPNSNFMDPPNPKLMEPGIRRWLRYVTVDPTNSDVIYGSSHSRFDDGADPPYSDGCVYKSIDGGASIQDISLPGYACTPGCDSPEQEGCPAEAPVIYSIVIDPAATNNLLASTSKGIFKSSDSGTSWSLVTNTGLPHTNARTMVLDAPTNTLYLVLQSRVTATGSYFDPTTWQGGVYKAPKSAWGQQWTAITGINGPNVLSNPGFNAGSPLPTNWSVINGNTVAVRDTSLKRTGVASLKITAQPTGGPQGVKSDTITPNPPIVAGQRYEVGVYAYVTGGSGSALRKIYGRVRWFNSAGNEITSNPICFPSDPEHPPVPSDAFDNKTSTASWRKFEGVVYVPANANKLSFELLTEETQGTTNFDDAYVARSNSLARVVHPGGGDFSTNYRALVADSANPGTVFVGTDSAYEDGVWKSTDYGTTWRRVTTQAPGDPVDTMVDGRAATKETAPCGWGRRTINPWYLGLHPVAGGSTLYMTTGWIYKSSDGGESWAETTSVSDGSGTDRWSQRGETSNIITFESAIEPGNPSRIYFGDDDNALMVSDNAGASFLNEGIKLTRSVWWDLLGNPDDANGNHLTPDAVTFILADAPNHAYAAGNSGESAAGAIFDGTYAGGQWTWTPVGFNSWPAGGPVSIARDATNQYLYASLLREGVYRYHQTDPAPTWEPIYIGKNGATCTPLTPPCPAPQDNPANPNCCDTANTSCVCTVSKLAYEPTMGRLFAATGDPFASGPSNDGGLWLSTNQGQSWTRITPASMEGEAVLSITPLATGEVYIGAWSNYVAGKGGLYRGELIAGNWVWSRILDQPRVAGAAVAPGDPQTIYAAAPQGAVIAPGPGIYKSTNGGASFTLLGNNGLKNKKISSMRGAAECQDGFPLIVTTLGGGIFVTQVQLPATPSGLSASSPALGTVLLNWVDTASTECGFTVERSAPGNESYQPLAKTAFNGASYTDASMATGTRFYRVKSYNAAGSSAASNEVSICLPALHCPAGAGECDGMPVGAPCGIPSCGGTCRFGCGGQFDCFKP